MTRKTSVLGALLLSLAALPAVAQPSIPPGNDYWRTPANGKTFFEFPAGDVEGLCGLPPVAGWARRATLQGVPATGSDWDTIVARIDKAVFNTSGIATTRVQIKHLAFKSSAIHSTPCGRLNWTAALFGVQPVTQMTIRRTTAQGGVFNARLLVSVEMKATDAGSGAYVGSLFYTRELPDPGAGTPWSFGPTGVFRAGMTETNNCVDVLRAKLNMTDPASSHWYFISDLIAAGKCTRQTGP
jgi:hypothetical protein